MEKNFSELLTQIDFFKLLPEAARLELLPFIEEMILEKNEVLFTRGSNSDFVYILLEGQLFGSIKSHGEEKIVSMIYPFEIIGELSAFSQEPRSLTISAEKQSKLIKLPSLVFEKICYKYPSVLTSIVKTLINRSQETINYIEGKKPGLYVVFLSAVQDKSCFDEFISSCNKYLPHHKIAILQEKDISNNTVDFLMQLEKHHDVIILFLERHHHDLIKMAMLRQFKFYLVVSANKKQAEIPDFAKSMMEELKFIPGIKPYLIILHSDDISFPKETKKWLDTGEYHLHHHVRMHNQLDYQRLFRFAFGKPVGIVLGGGGTRCWVHGGVIKALIEQRIPIDAIGGTSSGAWMAAGYAISKTYEEYQLRFTHSIRTSYQSFSARDLTWPTISLYSGRHVTDSLRSAFKEKKIEDFWIPFFCISSNVTSYKEAIHRQGLVWEKVRSSISMPGVLPPVVMDGEMHFDGGLMNNLPVDVMKDMLGLTGHIIACKLGQYKSSKGEYSFPPVIGFKESLLMKWGKSNYKAPEYFDTLIRTLMIGSFTKEKENGTIADVLISPDMAGYGMIDSYNASQEEFLIQMGYEETLKEINERKENKENFKFQNP